MRSVALVFVVACTSPSSQQAEPDASGGSGSGSSQIDAAVSTLTCDNKMAQPLDSTWNLTVGNMQRTAKVHVPSSYDPKKPTALVINAHGLTGSASQQLSVSHGIAKSDSSNFVVIHPEGTGTPRSWNAGTCCDPAATNNVDDMGFYEALLDEAANRLCLDPKRVYAMGLSNGGHISYRAGCELADRFAAVASVAGVLTTTTCNPSRPVPAIQIHGTADSIVVYSRGTDTVNFFKQKYGCTSMSQTFQNGSATCVTHTGCNGGADIRFCTVTGGGHQWPGGEELPFLGHKSDDLIATDAIWDFFVAHPKP